MPRKTRQETKIHLDRERRITLAMKSLSNGEAKSISQAAERFCIPKSTLHGRVHGHHVAAKDSQAHNQRLSPLEEEQLVDWIQELARCHLNPRLNQINYMAEVVLRARGVPLPLNQPSIGATWHKKFLARHDNLHTVLSRGLDHARAVALNRGNLDQWFSLFRSVCCQYGIRPPNLWNMDEVGVMMGMGGRSQIIVTKEFPQNYLRQDGDRGWITAIESISGNNRALPPLLIFATKSKKPNGRHQLRWYPRNPPPNWSFAVSETGWTNNELGLEWLKSHFEPLTRPENSDEYRLLVLDGHSSHQTTEFICFAREKKIILLCFPPHSTHVLQPLDVSVFQPLKYYYQREIEHDYRDGFCAIDRQRFIQVYEKIRPSVFSAKNIASAWEKTGLLSLNPGAVYEQLQLRPTTPPSQTRSNPQPQELLSSPLSQITASPSRPKTLEEFDHQERRFQECLEIVEYDASPAKKRHKLILEGARAQVVKANLWRQRYIELWQRNQDRPRKRAARKSIPMVGRVLTSADIEQHAMEEGETSDEDYEDTYESHEHDLANIASQHTAGGAGMEVSGVGEADGSEDWGIQPFNAAHTATAVGHCDYKGMRWFRACKRKRS